jgi:uncharacterized membrane protein
MSLVDAGAYAVHLLFAGLWAGSVLFVWYAVLPLGRDGNLNAVPLGTVAGKLKQVSRASATVLLLSGGHMAAQRYTVGTLTGSASGYLVLAMVVLWFVLAGLVETGTGKVADGTDRQKVREPAREAQRFLGAASVVAVLLLLDAGLLIADGLGIVSL